jgi:hypothetical protein
MIYYDDIIDVLKFSLILNTIGFIYVFLDTLFCKCEKRKKDKENEEKYEKDNQQEDKNKNI